MLPKPWSTSRFETAAFVSDGHADIKYLVAGRADEQPAGNFPLFSEHGMKPVPVPAGRADSELIPLLNFFDVMFHGWDLENDLRNVRCNS